MLGGSFARDAGTFDPKPLGCLWVRCVREGVFGSVVARLLQVPGLAVRLWPARELFSTRRGRDGQNRPCLFSMAETYALASTLAASLFSEVVSSAFV